MYSIFENRKKRVHTTSLSLSDYTYSPVLNRFSGACSKVTLLFDFITYYYIRLYCRLSPWCTYSLKTPIIKVLKKIKFPSLRSCIYIYTLRCVSGSWRPTVIAHCILFLSLLFLFHFKKFYFFLVYRVRITPLGHRFPLFPNLYLWTAVSMTTLT